MKRTSKEERKQNARSFYQIFNSYETNKACIVVERNENGRTQFLTVPSALSYANPVVIAESANLAIEGCWIEFIQHICGSIKQKTYYDDHFREWLKDTMGFEITHYDGFVFIIER